MRFSGVTRPLAALAVILGLSACGGSFRTHYDAPVTADNWVVSDVDVTVPKTLTVSEKEVFVPSADIVWREDPPGDRYAQVAGIMEAAIAQGASRLNGSRAVRLDVTMARFHAMTFTAETRAPAGVHDVEFTITARDAATGQILAGPDYIEASLPAMTRGAMAAARAHGETQKSQITDHVAKTIAGWLGAGPDIRQRFSSVGA